MSEESLADRARKLMPSITTYNSDDSIDGEDLSSSQESDVKEPAEPLTRHSPNLPNIDATNQRTDGILPYLSDSPSDYSSSSSDEEREEAFSRLAQKLTTVPVTELITSGEFNALRKRLSRQRISATRPVSAYAVFFQEVHPIIKSENPTIKFGELTRLIAARWDALSREEKRDYRRRGARFSQNECHPLLAYKSRLHKSAEIQRSCCYPSCNKPIKWDPRWNGQYCSPSCVSEHCRLAFMDWCAKKRLPLNAVVENHLPSKADILENGYQKSRLETIDVKKESQSDLAVNSDKQCANDLSIHQTVEGSASSYQPSDLGISVSSPSSVPNQVKPEEPPNDSGIMYRKSLFEALKNSTFSFPVATVRSNSNDGS